MKLPILTLQSCYTIRVLLKDIERYECDSNPQILGFMDLFIGCFSIILLLPIVYLTIHLTLYYKPTPPRMSHYDVPIKNAKTKWYGPLDFSITYSDDQELVVENTNLYVTGEFYFLIYEHMNYEVPITLFGDEFQLIK